MTNDVKATRNVVNESKKIPLTVGAKCIFLQPQLLRNIDSNIQILIIKYYNFFF